MNFLIWFPLFNFFKFVLKRANLETGCMNLTFDDGDLLNVSGSDIRTFGLAREQVGWTQTIGCSDTVR